MRNIFLYLVPGILALGFTAAYIFMMIEGREIPNELDTTVKIIIGYFFGAGVSAAAGAPPDSRPSSEDLQRQERDLE
jgi:hypothetical protein